MVEDLTTTERGWMQPLPHKILTLYNDKGDDIYECSRRYRLAKPLKYMNHQLNYLSTDEQALPPMNLHGRYTESTHWASTKPAKQYRCQMLLTATPHAACALKTTPYYHPRQTREKKIFSLPVKTLKNAKLVYG